MPNTQTTHVTRKTAMFVSREAINQPLGPLVGTTPETNEGAPRLPLGFCRCPALRSPQAPQPESPSAALRRRRPSGAAVPQAPPSLRRHRPSCAAVPQAPPSTSIGAASCVG
eukprot:scaffold1371_cov55-Phaeocystis_antarctica.AAC.8